MANTTMTFGQNKDNTVNLNVFGRVQFPSYLASNGTYGHITIAPSTNAGVDEVFFTPSFNSYEQVQAGTASTSDVKQGRLIGMSNPGTLGDGKTMLKVVSGGMLTTDDSANVGSDSQPIYLKGGVLTPCTSVQGNSGSYINAKTISLNTYEGMATSTGDDSDWIRTTSNGIIPYQSGGPGEGHSMLGTSTYYFREGYIDIIHGSLIGTASRLQNLATTDNASTSDVWRKLWMSYSDGVTGRPALSDNLTFQTSTNTLKTNKILINGSTLAFKTNSYPGDIIAMNADGKKRYELWTPGTDGAANGTMLRVYSDANGTTSSTYSFGKDGVLTISAVPSTTTENKPAGIVLNPIQKKADGTSLDNLSNTGSIKVYDDHDDLKYGTNMVIQSGSNMIVGAGEAPTTYYNNYIKGKTSTSITPGGESSLSETGENLALISDGSILFITHANAIADMITCYIDGNGYYRGVRVYNAVWNDYAEFRSQKETVEPGYVVLEQDDGKLIKSTARLQKGGLIVSDTFGTAMGETDDCQTPIAVAGRVLAYTYEPREMFHAGDAVCTGPDGKVSLMTEEEEEKYPLRCIGIVSEIPDYEEWGTGNVKVNGRIWIKVK